MNYDDLCELFYDVRCNHETVTFQWIGLAINETINVWFEGKRYRAEAQRTEPVPAHRRGTYVTENGRTVWDETDMRTISAPTIKQLVRKLTEEGEYRL